MAVTTATDPAATIRRGYALFADHDMAALMELLDPAIVWTISGPDGLDGDYRGREGVGAFFAKLPWERLEVRPEEYVADGERVVAIGRHVGRGPGGDFDVPFAHVWRVRDGRALSFVEYTDTEELARVLHA